MTKVLVKYNPYIVSTEIYINDSKVSEQAPIAKHCEGKRLQEWIEPSGARDDFFTVLKRTLNTREVYLTFNGTELDFEDFKEAKDIYGNNVFDKIELELKRTSEQKDKMNELKNLFIELQKQNASINTVEVREAFVSALNPSFEIVIIAPMSSGKSTLINAILGENLLPAMNKATTSKITRIKNNNALEQFVVSAYDKCRKVIILNDIGEVEKVPADLKLIKELNKSTEVDEIFIEGNIPNINTEYIDLVFVDTPGGNNALSNEHKRIMKSAIEDENKNVILYVFNGTTLTSEDGNEILVNISNAMKESANGKQSRDRFIFVANRMDDVNTDEESYESMVETISYQLAQNAIGIVNPNLFLVSAKAAKLVRMENKGVKLTGDNKRDCAYLKEKFEEEDKELTQFSTIRQSVKNELIREMKKAREQENINRVVEINSGVPALETAILEYLEKYALAIKIKMAHDIFIRKEKELAMITNAQQQWIRSNEEYNKIVAELKEKQELLENSKKQQQFVKAIEEIRLDESSINKLKIQINKKIQSYNLQQSILKKPEAISLIGKFKKDLEAILEEACKSIDEEVNVRILDSCKAIINQYQEYVEELDREGMLNVGSYYIRNTDAYNSMKIPEPYKLLRYVEENKEEYIAVINEKVDEKQYKIKGIGNFFKRLFDQGGWGVEEIYDDVNYIMINKLVSTKLTEVAAEFDELINDAVNDAKAQIDGIKKFTKEKLGNIDNEVKKQYRELQTNMRNRDRLLEKLEQDRRNMEWVRKFVEQMDSILEI